MSEFFRALLDWVAYSFLIVLAAALVFCFGYWLIGKLSVLVNSVIGCDKDDDYSGLQ